MSFGKEYFIGPIDLTGGPALTPATPATQTTTIATQGLSAAQYAPRFVYPPGHIPRIVHALPWKPVYPRQAPPIPTYNCRACQFYSGCGIWKNDPYYSCERCISDTAAGWRRVSDPRAGHSYQNCALNCYCRS